MEKQYIDKDRVCRVVDDVMDYIEEHNIISSTIIRNKLIYELSQIAPADTKEDVIDQIKEKIPDALYDKVSEELLKDQVFGFIVLNVLPK